MAIFNRDIEYEEADAEFFPEGTLREATLSHDAEIQGVPCSGGRSAVFYASGHLKLAMLSKPVVLDGVPCSTDQNVFFHENGQLMNAELGAAHEFAGAVLPAGTRVTMNETGRLVEYSHELSADQLIDGIPCGSPFWVWRYPSGRLSKAVLSAPVKIDGQDYQRGTELCFSERGNVMRSLVLKVDFNKRYKQAVCGVFETPWQ